MRSCFLILALGACISAMKKADLEKAMKDCDMYKEGQFDYNPLSDPGARVKAQCIFRKLDIINQNGMIQKNMLKTRIADFITYNNEYYAAKILDWCFVKQGDLKDTILHLAQFCFNSFSRNTLNAHAVISEITLANFKCEITIPVETLKLKFVAVPNLELALVPKFRCLAETLGAMDTNGKINKDVARRLLTEEFESARKVLPFRFSTRKMVDMVIEKCAAEKESPDETVLYVFECMYSVFASFYSD